jgi:23S rRNA-/tRNA-specific pseudouridylate synthase
MVTSRLDTGRNRFFSNPNFQNIGTHGLLVYSRSTAFQGLYNTMLGDRQVKKHYQAVVLGWKPEIHDKWKMPVTLKHYLSNPKKR